MTNIVTKGGAVILKDGKAAEDCECCGWRCTANSPSDQCVLEYAYQPVSLHLNGFAITGIGSQQHYIDGVPYVKVLQHLGSVESGAVDIWQCDMYGNTDVRAWYSKIRFYNLGSNTFGDWHLRTDDLCANASPRMGEFVNTGDVPHDQSPLVKTIETIIVSCSGMASCSLGVRIDTTRFFRLYNCSALNPNLGYTNEYVERNWWPGFPSDQYDGPIVLTNTNISGIIEPFYAHTFSEWFGPRPYPEALVNLAPPEFNVSVSAELQPYSCVS
jgi:hypothetical protein